MSRIVKNVKKKDVQKLSTFLQTGRLMRLRSWDFRISIPFLGRGECKSVVVEIEREERR
jgi:hypothetical protein